MSAFGTSSVEFVIGENTRIYTGIGAPDSNIGSIGDLYIRKDAPDIYIKNADEIGWSKAAGASTGPAGYIGSRGYTGSRGQGIIPIDVLADFQDLPLSGNTIGDAYIINNDIYFWNGSSWVSAGRLGPSGYTGSQGSGGARGFTGSKGDVGSSLTVLGTLNEEGDLPPSSNDPGDAYIIDNEMWVWDGDSWENVGNFQGFTGSKGDLGYTGSQGTQGNPGTDGNGINLLGSVDTALELPELDVYSSYGAEGNSYVINGYLYVWDGDEWKNSGQIIGYTGSAGFVGSRGFSGSQGFTGSTGAGFTGSRGFDGYVGSRGYTGSIGRDITAVNSSIPYMVTTSLDTAWQVPSTLGKRYEIKSLYLTNITSVDTTVTAEIDFNGLGQISLANEEIIEGNTTVNLLSKSINLYPDDSLLLEAGDNDALSAIISYMEHNDVNIVRNGVDLVNTNNVDVFVSGGANGTIVSSIRLTNDGVSSADVIVTWTDDSNIIQAYLAYELEIPANSHIELLTTSIYIPNGHRIRTQASVADCIEVYVSGLDN